LPKEVSEDIGKIMKAATEKISELKIPHQIFCGPTFADSNVAGGVIFPPFDIVGEHGVRLRNFFEPVFGLWLAVSVWMKFQRELSVGLLNLVSGGGTVYP
jgi:hypothetical protein